MDFKWHRYDSSDDKHFPPENTYVVIIKSLVVSVHLHFNKSHYVSDTGLYLIEPPYEWFCIPQEKDCELLHDCLIYADTMAKGIVDCDLHVHTTNRANRYLDLRKIMKSKGD